MTAAFNPAQARDKRGRWIEMGSLVKFDYNGRGMTGEVEGTSENGSGIFVRTKDGERFMKSGRDLEVIDAKARLPEPGEEHPEIQKKKDREAAQAESSPLKEVADRRGEIVKLGEQVAWTRERGADDTFDRGGNDKLIEIREDGSFVVENKWGDKWEVPAGRGTLTKIQPDAALDADGTALLKSLEESARMAGWSNDGYDKAASGRESAFNEAAKMVKKKGATPEVAAELRSRAEKAAKDRDSQYDYHGYNPFDAGAADGYSQAADMVEKLTGGSSVDTPEAPAVAQPDNIMPAVPGTTGDTVREALKNKQGIGDLTPDELYWVADKVYEGDFDYVAEQIAAGKLKRPKRGESPWPGA